MLYGIFRFLGCSRGRRSFHVDIINVMQPHRHRLLRRAFTLIELLFVISIIGLLASIILSSLSATKIHARDTERISQIQEVYKALEVYETAHPGHLPNCADVGYVGGCDITSYAGQPVLVDSSQDGHYVDFLIQAGLLSKELADPINSYPYLYWYGSGYSSVIGGTPGGTYYNFILGTLLEDPTNPIMKTSYDLGVPSAKVFYIIAEVGSP